MAISDLAAVEELFKSHEVSPAQEASMGLVREACRELAKILIVSCPDRAERTLAIRSVEQAMFWANASISRHKEKT